MSTAWVFILPEFFGKSNYNALTGHPSKGSAGNLKNINIKIARLIPNIQNLFFAIITVYYKITGRLTVIKLGKKLSAFLTKFGKIE
jgi:hypothetical protein